MNGRLGPHAGPRQNSAYRPALEYGAAAVRAVAAFSPRTSGGDTETGGRICSKYFRRWTMAKTRQNSEADSHEATAVYAAKLAIGLLLAGVVWCVFFSDVPLNHDDGMFLHCGELLVEGYLPYVGYVELNPPMVHYVHAIPALLARWLGFPAPTVFLLCVLALVVYSARAVFRMASLPGTPYSRPAVLFLTACWITYTLVIALALGFGQREHLFMLVCMPWVYCRIARHEGREVPFAASLVLGIVAGPFILFKPHFCVMVALLEMWMLFRSRRFHTLLLPESVIVAAWTAAYLVHFLFVPAEMRQAFWNRWMPLTVQHYAAYNTPVDWVILLSLGVIIAAGLHGIWTARRLDEPLRLHVETLSVGVLAGVLIVIMQHKFWDYHTYPTFGFLCMMFMTRDMARLDSGRNKQGVPASRYWQRRRVALVFGVLVILFPLLAWGLGFPRRSQMREENSQWCALIRDLAQPGEGVAFISSAVPPAYPCMTYTQAPPGTRFLCAFPIPMLYEGTSGTSGRGFPYHLWAEQPEVERRFLEDLGRDIIERRPRLVMVQAEDAPQACPPGFRVDEYLRRSGWQEHYTNDYALLKRFRDYLVFRRKS